MKKIDFEAHFITEKWVEALVQNREYPKLIEDKEKKTRRLYFTEEANEPFGDVLFNNLLDVGEGRLKKMDEASIDVQVCADCGGDLALPSSCPSGSFGVGGL